LSPAIVQNIKIEKEKAIVSITSDQKAKAIGKSGINIRLASMLTGYAIELNEIEGKTTEPTDTKESTKTTDTSALANLFR